MDLSSTLSGVESGKPTHFTVLNKGAGKAVVDVSFSSPVKDFDIIDNYDYSQTVKYTPAKQVQLQLQMSDQPTEMIVSQEPVWTEILQNQSPHVCPRDCWHLPA